MTLVPTSSSGGSGAFRGALLWTHDTPVSDGVLNWQGADFDAGGFVAGDGSGFIIPAGMGGAYLFAATLAFVFPTTAPTYLSVILDFTPEPILWSPYSTAQPNSTTYTGNGFTSSGFGVSVSAMGRFSAGDHVKVRPEWAGVEAPVLTAQELSQFGCVYLGEIA